MFAQTISSSPCNSNTRLPTNLDTKLSSSTTSMAPSVDKIFSLPTSLHLSMTPPRIMGCPLYSRAFNHQTPSISRPSWGCKTGATPPHSRPLTALRDMMGSWRMRSSQWWVVLFFTTTLVGRTHLLKWDSNIGTSCKRNMLWMEILQRY